MKIYFNSHLIKTKLLTFWDNQFVSKHTHFTHKIRCITVSIGLNIFAHIHMLKVNTMQLVTPGGNHCCLIANDVMN